MNASKTPAIPRRAAPGGSMSTEDIKARIEAMFADSPAPAPRAPRKRRFA
ncbi:hypothetical protein [Rhodococcus sp. OK302]|nr:hypothetical protein [Rhodococcus sp. OK302]OYD61371.1 hypothetical protein BDB13_6349 [Rhodococcus sp. OK302]